MTVGNRNVRRDGRKNADTVSRSATAAAGVITVIQRHRLRSTLAIYFTGNCGLYAYCV